LDNQDYWTAVDIYRQYGEKAGIRQSEGYEQALRKCYNNHLMNGDLKNARLIRVNLCGGMDFATEDEMRLISWLNENNKKSIAQFFKYFPDETKQAFSGFLENGWLDFADRLYSILKDRPGWVNEEAARKASAIQGVLNSLEKGDLDNALGLHKNYVKQRDFWSEPETIEAGKAGFYNCLISGKLEEALRFWKKFSRSTDLIETLNKAYDYCITQCLTDTARAIYIKFEGKADFSKF
jgi:hypothetical protein